MNIQSRKNLRSILTTIFCILLFSAPVFSKNQSWSFIFDYGTLSALTSPFHRHKILQGDLRNRITLLQSLKKDNPNSVMIHLGDNFSGSHWLSHLGQGRWVASILSQIPYDAIRFTRDDLTFSAVQIEKVAKRYDLPFLMSSPSFQRRYQWFSPLIQVFREEHSLLIFADIHRKREQFQWSALERFDSCQIRELLAEQSHSDAKQVHLLLTNHRQLANLLQHPRNAESYDLVVIPDSTGNKIIPELIQLSRSTTALIIPTQPTDVFLIKLSKSGDRAFSMESKKIHFSKNSPVSPAVKALFQRIKNDYAKKARDPIAKTSWKKNDLYRVIKEHINADAVLFHEQVLLSKTGSLPGFIPLYFKQFRQDYHLIIYSLSVKKLLAKLRILKIFHQKQLKELQLYGITIDDRQRVFLHLNKRKIPLNENEKVRVLMTKEMANRFHLNKNSAIMKPNYSLIPLSYQAFKENFAREREDAEK